MRSNVTAVSASGAPGRRERAEVWSRYRGNLARHLIGVSRDLESRVVQSLDEEGGYQDLRPSFGPFLSLIWDEPKPLSRVTDELAISPQASSQLANRVEAAGYSRRVSNPEDRRSKVVGLTSRGRSLVETGVRLILERESAYSKLLGATTHRRFIAALAALYEGLGLPTHADAKLARRARHSVGVLPLITVRVQRELMNATIARGHPGLKMSHGQVLPLIGAEGGRIVEIARIQGVSRQAISTISQDLESLGYLRRNVDPRDRRGIVLELTSRGEGLIEDSVAALDDLEASFQDLLGERRLGYLKRGALDLYSALHLEEEIFESNLAGEPSRDDDSIEKRDRNELRQLASRLRKQLGQGDAARLGVLLSPDSGRNLT